MRPSMFPGSRQVVFDRARRLDRLPGRRCQDQRGGAQFPDEAVLRRRAYFHTLDLTKAGAHALLATDRKADAQAVRACLQARRRSCN